MPFSADASTAGEEDEDEEENCTSDSYDAREDEVSVASSLLGQHHPGVGSSSDPLGLFGEGGPAGSGESAGVCACPCVRWLGLEYLFEGCR